MKKRLTWIVGLLLAIKARGALLGLVMVAVVLILIWGMIKLVTAAWSFMGQFEDNPLPVPVVKPVEERDWFVQNNFSTPLLTAQPNNEYYNTNTVNINNDIQNNSNLSIDLSNNIVIITFPAGVLQLTTNNVDWIDLVAADNGGQVAVNPNWNFVLFRMRP